MRFCIDIGNLFDFATNFLSSTANFSSLCVKLRVSGKNQGCSKARKSPKTTLFNAIFEHYYSEIPHISVRDTGASGRTRTYNPSVNSSARCHKLKNPTIARIPRFQNLWRQFCGSENATFSATKEFDFHFSNSEDEDFMYIYEIL